MKLLLVILEGQLYLAGIAAVFAAELAALLWGLWSRRPLIGLLAVFATVPLIGFDARAATYRPRWPPRRHRALVLGLPVLTTLSSAELRAVVAHELAWYVPRLDRAAAEVSRRHELMADQVAARSAGSRAAADALVAFEAGEHFAENAHWPRIQTSHVSLADPPRLFSEMLTWDARKVSEEVLAEIVVDDSAPDDTHPSMKDAALPFYMSVDGHAAAGVAAGRVLLDRMDSAGIPLIEDAMSSDERLVPEGCRILSDYYRHIHQELAARTTDRRARRHETLKRLARPAYSNAGSPRG